MYFSTAHSLWDRKNVIYNGAVFIYLLHMALMANLTWFYPGLLMRFRMPSFVFVAAFLLFALLLRAADGHRFPTGAVVSILTLLAMLLLGFLHSQENAPYIKNILFSGYFIKYVILFAAAFLFEDDPDRRVRQLTVIAMLSLLTYQLGAWLSVYDDSSYMDIGYGCAPWWILLTQGIFYHKNRIVKLLCAVTSLYFAVFIALYGNRGALLLIVLATIILLATYLPSRYIIVFGGLALVGVIVLALCWEQILLLAEKSFLAGDGVSRNLRLLLSGQLMYDSGRFPIYRACLNSIAEHPFLGVGACGDRVVTVSHDYAHNIILELCVEYGVIIGGLIYLFLLYIGFRMLFKCKDRAWRALFLPFYVFSMVELFFSGTFLQRGHVLASVVIYFAYSACNQRRGNFKEANIELASKT